MSNLFRQEAVDHQRHRLLGDIVLLQPVRFTIFTAFLTAAVLAIGVFLWAGTYTRKETVAGYVTPRGGIVTLRGQPGSTVETVHVTEGAQVAAGDPIITLSLSEAVEDGLRLGELQERSIERQRSAIMTRLEADKERLATANQDDEALIRQLEDERAAIGSSLKLADEGIALTKQALANQQTLLERGIVAKAALDDERKEVLAAEQAKLELQLRSQGVGRRIADTRTRIVQRSLEEERMIAAAREERARLDTQRSVAIASDTLTLRAPAAATVTGLYTNVGQSVDVNTSLVALRRKGDLVIQLMVPTRAAGFIRPNQMVRVMYDAFPYQRYGIHEATIQRVATSVLLPGERVGPLRLDEPAYRAIVAPQEQGIQAFGQFVPLQPGMLVRADIVLDERSFVDFILDPIRAIRG